MRNNIIFMESACALLVALCPITTMAREAQSVIVSPENATSMEKLAAREVRRYVYLRTGRLLPILTAEKKFRNNVSAIVVAKKDRAVFGSVANDAKVKASLQSLNSQGYLLKTVLTERGQVLLLAGGDDVGTLYAAYRFAENMGIRFYLHGDVIPDEQTEWKLPVLDEQSKPLFALRGIQPFHDFPEGPDWWNTDDYLAIIAQLPKLRMNFIGLHTYPEGHPNAEPTVWIGLPQDIGKGGKVKFSYPASYQNTLRGNWGYAPKKTGDFLFGSSQLFENDAFGSDAMFGHCPQPETPADCNEVFARTATMLGSAFQFAHELGVKTCVGTETPLVIPKAVQGHLASLGKNSTNSATIEELYEGIFEHAAQAYPLDYFWLWTPETWTFQNIPDAEVKRTMVDLLTANDAAKKVSAPFQLATCGWVLGPQTNRAAFGKILPPEMTISCINRHVGNLPVDRGFADITKRSKWAIPWLEDDGALTSPQFWVARMRRDAADALQYGCDGLMGIHWRTRVLSPNVGALAQAAWDQSGWIKSYSGTNALQPSGRPAFPSAKDFYEDWALHEFGGNAAADAATIFQKLDCATPRPSTWVGGPGGIKPDGRLWKDVVKEYAFLEAFGALDSRIKGAGARERFDYWLNTFRFMRANAEVNCLWAEYNNAMGKVRAVTNSAHQKQFALSLVLPLREKLVQRVDSVFQYLLATVSTTGELGMVANWNQHILPDLLTKPGQELEKILGEPLPASGQPKTSYHGPTRVIVPTLRSSVHVGEALTLKAIVVSEELPRSASLYWRRMGEGRFANIPLQHVSRGVYSVQIPLGRKSGDLEYYVEVKPRSGKPVYFPAAAPKRSQTVIEIN